MRKILRHGTEKQLPDRNEWVRVDMDYPARESDLRRSGVEAICACARGHLGSLRTHTVAKNGDVTPSYVCAYPGCDYHEWVTLEGWPARPEEKMEEL